MSAIVGEQHIGLQAWAAWQIFEYSFNTETIRVSADELFAVLEQLTESE